MDQFVMFPVNENGVFSQPKIVGQTIVDAMSRPFPFTDIFIYSHGWWTFGNAAMVQYGQYTVEFTRNLFDLHDALAHPPVSTFGMGVHWPSTMSEDESALQEVIQTTTYYQMGTRAQQVGATGLYAALVTMFQTRSASNLPFKLNLIGHSFGCRVVASALERVATELAKASADPLLKSFVYSLPINLVLLQAAFKNNELDEGGNFEHLGVFPNLRILVTTSGLDKALNTWFPKAEELTNLLHLKLSPAEALGGSPNGGPTASTRSAYDVRGVVSVDVGFGLADLPASSKDQRMIVADLSPLHAARQRLYAGDPNEGFAYSESSGSHGDIACPEIYTLISGFCFQ